MSGLLLFRRPLHARCLSSRLHQVRRYALIGKPKQQGEPAWALPKTPARTRFAPSPTGYLHLGSLRTALYNYLLAQATGGQFVIRLEDTDRNRFVADSESRLYDDLTWAGLQWDEGPDKGGPFGPYKQSDRLDLYKQHAESLLASDHAFRCFCTQEDLEFNIKQATAGGHAAHYPGTCMGITKSESDRRAANGEPHTIRFKAAEVPVSAPDLVYGAYKKNEREDNFIIMKSDGYPTYHFANVIDDHFMKITHVIRGAEWLISTPKHVELYNAFGWQPPSFAHVGLLVDSQRQKLSKRDMDNIGINVYRANKIMPEALLNYSALLGWDPNLQNNRHLNKQGVMTLDDMKRNFTLKFTRGDIVVDLAKLKFFQTKLARGLVSGDIADPEALRRNIVQPIMAEIQKFDAQLQKYRHSASSVDDEVREICEGISERVIFEDGITEDHALTILKSWKGSLDNPVQFFYDNIFAFYPIAKATLMRSFLELQDGVARVKIDKGKNFILNADISKTMVWFRSELKQIEANDWNQETLGHVVKRLAMSIQFYDTKKDQLMDQSAGWKFMRWALLNNRSGLPIVPMMVLWGRQESLRRLKSARVTAQHQEEMLKANVEEAGRRELARRVHHRHMREAFGQDIKEDEDIKRYSQEIEARNVEVRGRIPVEADEEVEQNPPPQDEPRGPFATVQSRLVRRSPREVQRSPVLLPFHEWKTATRHLDLHRKSDGHTQSPSKPGAPLQPRGPGSRGSFLPGDPIPDLAAHIRQIQIANRRVKNEDSGARAQDEPAVGRYKVYGRLKEAMATREKGSMFTGPPVGGIPWAVSNRSAEQFEDILSAVNHIEADRRERMVRKEREEEESVSAKEIEQRVASWARQNRESS